MSSADRYDWLGKARNIVNAAIEHDREMEALIYRRKRKVEHRPVVLPAASLSSPKKTREKMESEGRCRLCPSKVLTRHHVVPQSWFLGQPEPLRQIRNAHANIVPLCRPCHDQVESRHPVAREMARRDLRATLTQQEVAFAIHLRGRGWLAEQYPEV